MSYLQVVHSVREHSKHAEVVVHHHVGDVTVDEDLSGAKALRARKLKQCPKAHIQKQEEGFGVSNGGMDH